MRRVIVSSVPTAASGHTADDQAETVLVQPAAGRRRRRPGGHASRAPSSDPRPASGRHRARSARRPGSRPSTIRATTILRSCATASATSSCPSWPTSPVVTPSRSSPVRPTMLRAIGDHLRARAVRAVDVTDVAALSRRARGGGPRSHCVSGCGRVDDEHHPPDARDRRPGPRRGLGSCPGHRGRAAAGGWRAPPGGCASSRPARRGVVTRVDRLESSACATFAVRALSRRRRRPPSR